MSLRSLSLQTGSSSDASAPGGETGELLASLRVESGAFSGLEASLTSLHLGHNGLRQLPGGEICRLSQLTALNLTHNRFGAAADIFGAVTRITALDAAPLDQLNMILVLSPTTGSLLLFTGVTKYV